MSDDEQYLRDLGRPEDAWVLNGQQWYTAVEVGRHLGIGDDGVRSLADRGSFPGAMLHDVKRIGWRIPRDGLIAYVAKQRRQTEARRDTGTSVG